MWTLKNIYAQNICAFKEMDYTPNQGCTTLVFGNNLDNDSQGSNGSGKSALIETIAIGLTGDSLRKVKADEIINDAADEAKVVLTLVNDETKDTFIIERILGRTAPQQITTSLNGEIVVQPTVLEYNRYILDVIGLTKEDIFSNYILSKHKYASFLMASDREKKELINRFSNGSMVDIAIESLDKDVAEGKTQLLEAEKKVANIQGRISGVTEQIDTFRQECQAKENRKTEIIAAHEESIAKFRGKIREAKEREAELNAILEKQDKADARIMVLEETHVSLIDAYKEIAALFADCNVDAIPDYSQRNNELQEKLRQYRNRIEATNSDLIGYEREVERATKTYNDLAEELKNLQASHLPRTKKLNEEISAAQERIKEIENQNRKIRDDLRELDNRLADVQKMLAGTIECPKCRHQFILESEKSVSELQKDVESIERKIGRVKKAEKDNIQKEQADDSLVRDNRQELREMTNAADNLSQRVREAQMRLNNLTSTLNTLKSEYDNEKSTIERLDGQLLSLRKNLFDDAFANLDAATKRAEGELEGLSVKIEGWNGNIASYEDAIKQTKESNANASIEAFEKQIEKYNLDLKVAIHDKESLEYGVNELVAQSTRFTEFKTHLANSKIEALGQMTNEFLEAIGSDLRIAFSGYTTLRSGKVRDKISISVMRDGIDCGSFAKMSQGEQCRANLASILALHKLTNVNCEEGKGLDLLVLDEVLDATDEQGLSSMFDALNNLQITAMVVSHGQLAENYPYRLTVTKQNGISTLNGNDTT